MNLHRLLTFGVLLLGLAASGRAHADQVPQLSVNARMIHANGSPGSSSASPHPMVVGQGVTSYVFASESLCGVGAARDGKLDDVLKDQTRGYLWKVTRTGVSHVNGLLTFDLEWSRYDDGSPISSASAKQRLTLNEGTSYPIDMLRAASPGTCTAGAVILEIAASAIEAPAFADTVLQYDLWVTHQDGTGRKQTRHFVVSAKQGTAGAFEFPPFRFGIPRLTVDQYDLDLVTRVIGSIKGRLRENGTVDVELETRRVDRLEMANENKPAMARAGGRKTMTLRLDETVEVELPNGSGFSARGASPQTPTVSGKVGIAPRTTTMSSASAVALKDGMIIVSFREFFDDDRFSVLVRVRKE
jgi:hypothetical protein